MTNDDYVVITGKKWAKGSRRFESSITHHPTRGSQGYLPRPIIESWNYPKKVVFEWNGDSVTIKPAKRQEK